MKKKIAVMMIAMAMSMSVMACGTQDDTLTIQTVTAESLGAGAETVAETAQESEAATEAPTTEAVETVGSAAGETAAESGITAGEYTSSYDGSTMTITDNNDGTYNVNLSLYRLTTLDDCVGTMDGDKMTVEAVDPNEGKMVLEITAESDGTLTVTVTDSTWELLSNGTAFPEFQK